MTKKNSGNNQGSGGSRGGQSDTASQQPAKPSDNGRKSIYNDNGGRKSSVTTNSGGPRERG